MSAAAVKVPVHGYIGYYNGKRLELYASTAYEATQKAIEHFKPPKSKRHMVTAMLAEKDGELITHTPDF